MVDHTDVLIRKAKSQLNQAKRIEASLYPDWIPEKTFVVKRLLTEEYTWQTARDEVEAKFGKILEDVFTEDKATAFGTAFFRVNRPTWWVNSGK